LFHQNIYNMRAYETRTARYQYFHLFPLISMIQPLK
jgi:hypothetical protein